MSINAEPKQKLVDQTNVIERILLDHPGFCVGWRGVPGTVPLGGHRFVTGIDSQRTDAYHQISNRKHGKPRLR